MTAVDDKLKALSDKQDQLGKEITDYVADVTKVIAAKDAIITDLQTQLGDLKTKLNADELTLAQVGASIDAAIDKTEKALADTPDVPTAPVVTPTP